MKRIGILIVTYNALTTLYSVLKRIPQDVWTDVEEVAIFDDASHDSTVLLAKGIKHEKNMEKLTIIKNKKNLGYGGNQKAGYEYFSKKNFDIVVLLHGDGQYAPEFLKEMYTPLVREEAEAVFGSRMMPHHGGPLKGGMPLYKYVGNKILTYYENKMLNMNLTEFHSGYRAYSLRALQNIDFLEMTNDFHFDTEIIIKINHQHMRIKEISIPTYYGDEICYVNGMKYAKNVFNSIKNYRKTCSGASCHSPFKEYFPYYAERSQQSHTSHAILLQLAGSKNNILDLGCSIGEFAGALTRAGNTVWGVDKITPQDVAMANFADFYLANLTQPLELPNSWPQKFDIILCGDILEHLPQPEILLEECHKHLKENGRVLISIPNIANIFIRISLLFGEFNYKECGILDKTHLRFFTKKTAKQLLISKMYYINKTYYSTIPIYTIFSGSKNIFTNLLFSSITLLTKIFPNIFSYQFIFEAKRK